MPQNTIANQYYEAERILDEKVMGDKLHYLIKWKGFDQTGKPWDPTWEPASHCTPPLIASWEQNNRTGKRKFRSPIPSSPSNNPLKTPPIKRERKHQKLSGGFSYGTPSANMGASADSPMVIDSDDDSLRNYFLKNPSFSKLSLVDGSSGVSPTPDVMNVKIQRQSLHPFHILLPVPLSKLQQIAYKRTIDKPQVFKYLAETNLATPPEIDSIIFQTKDQLLKIVNHLSLLLSSASGHLQGTNGSYQNFDKTGKLVMMQYLLNGLRNSDLTLGIAIPQGPIMNSIIKDFMKKHKFNFIILNETANKKLVKDTSSDKLLCIVFTTPLPKMNEEELPQFDLVIAYDTTFNQKKHLLHTKTNENIPVIRLVTKNTLEHALNYQMFQHQEDNSSISNLSLFEMKRILTFGLWKKNQFVEAGCELTKFDIQGTCDKVFQWISDGMTRPLSFGMETAVEKVWGKTIPPEHVTFDRLRLIGTGTSKERKDLKDVKDLALVKAEKRISEVNDEGNLKRRKDKEVAQDDDDNFQKKKKIKIIEETPKEMINSSGSSKSDGKTLSLTTEIPTILSPTEPLTESPIEQINPMSLNKPKQTQSPKNSRDDSNRESRRNSLKDLSKDSYNKSRDSTQDTLNSSSSKSSIRESNNKILSKDSNKTVRSISKDSNKSNKDSSKEQVKYLLLVYF
ncbi:hypothetical protein C1645_489168 [Glomus cerebriforme]|uniref:Chromo domain-containing protein n=1 Tax=Glomus cerebriforme TaxID=658196 RepID=A0A397TDH9_9GLOM|nr:hypothetical protein C1645_489168 [Glomus cerebriforme]